MIRLIVTSATYRQSAQVSKEKLERDPYNRLLTRGPRLRLDAEFIRDNALAISGLLNNQVGGPSVKPYQPAGIWDGVDAKYEQDHGELLYRRGMYVFWRRSAHCLAIRHIRRAESGSLHGLSSNHANAIAVIGVDERPGICRSGTCFGATCPERGADRPG